MMAVVKVSTKANMESRPRVSSMAKNRNDHNGETGILDTASGYAMKAKAGPLFTTSFTSCPVCSAINPKIEKITKPANTDVPQLMKETKRASL